MENFDVNQVMKITGWTRPTAYSFMQKNGGKIIDNGNSPKKWAISHETVSTFIKEEEKAVADKRARYWEEMRTTEAQP